MGNKSPGSRGLIWARGFCEGTKRTDGLGPVRQVAELLSRKCNRTALVAALHVGRPARVRKRILVIEDDVDLVELLRYQLTQAGFLTLAAADGADGLEKVRSLRPDLILLDLMLPELDGFALCEILRRDRATRTVPIIILSAMSGELARVAGLGAGANDFLSKPFSLKVLIYRIQTILGETHKTGLVQPTGKSE